MTHEEYLNHHGYRYYLYRFGFPNDPNVYFDDSGNLFVDFEDETLTADDIPGEYGDTLLIFARSPAEAEYLAFMYDAGKIALDNITENGPKVYLHPRLACDARAQDAKQGVSASQKENEYYDAYIASINTKRRPKTPAVARKIIV
jgi:hypothetical protein